MHHLSGFDAVSRFEEISGFGATDIRQVQINDN